MSQTDLETVRRIVVEKLRRFNVRVYLFGSHARGQASRISDVDVAVLPLEPLPPGVLSEVREALEESSVVFRVDVVDISESSPLFRQRVTREGIEWHG